MSHLSELSEIAFESAHLLTSINSVFLMQDSPWELEFLHKFPVKSDANPLSQNTAEILLSTIGNYSQQNVKFNIQTYLFVVILIL